jgi:prepilin-type N-terminal cleavage/methylation domain-containing protein
MTPRIKIPWCRGQRGFTLLEVVLGAAIVCVLGAGIPVAIAQVAHTNTRNTSYMVATRELENAAHWLNRDVQMAQKVTPQGAYGFPLEVKWVDWDNSRHQVTYVIEDGQLQRQHSENGGAATTLNVAQYLDTALGMNHCVFADSVLTFTITVKINDGATEAVRSVTQKVLPRARA